MASEDNDNNAPDSWEQELNNSDVEQINSNLSNLNVNAEVFVPGQNVHAPAFVPSFMKDSEESPEGKF